jgi:hypothetical protein
MGTRLGSVSIASQMRHGAGKTTLNSAAETVRHQPSGPSRPAGGNALGNPDDFMAAVYLLPKQINYYLVIRELSTFES